MDSFYCVHHHHLFLSLFAQNNISLVSIEVNWSLKVHDDHHPRPPPRHHHHHHHHHLYISFAKFMRRIDWTV